MKNQYVMLNNETTIKTQNTQNINKKEVEEKKKRMARSNRQFQNSY